MELGVAIYVNYTVIYASDRVKKNFGITLFKHIQTSSSSNDFAVNIHFGKSEMSQSILPILCDSSQLEEFTFA